MLFSFAYWDNTYNWSFSLALAGMLSFNLYFLYIQVKFSNYRQNIKKWSISKTLVIVLLLLASCFIAGKISSNPLLTGIVALWLMSSAGNVLLSGK
jgi:hypothetical protein